jgi:hypothetical protein
MPVGKWVARLAFAAIISDNLRTDKPDTKGNSVMARKKPTESALTNVLISTVELLQDAEIGEDDGMITVSNSVYMRLRAVVKEATGVAYGIAVSEESQEEDEDSEEEDENEDDEDDD